MLRCNDHACAVRKGSSTVDQRRHLSRLCRIDRTRPIALTIHTPCLHFPTTAILCSAASSHVIPRRRHLAAGGSDTAGLTPWHQHGACEVRQADGGDVDGGPKLTPARSLEACAARMFERPSVDDDHPGNARGVARVGIYEVSDSSELPFLGGDLVAAVSDQPHQAVPDILEARPL
jgi:hypothetical protein